MTTTMLGCTYMYGPPNMAVIDLASDGLKVDTTNSSYRLSHVSKGGEIPATWPWFLHLLTRRYKERWFVCV